MVLKNSNSASQSSETPRLNPCQTLLSWPRHATSVPSPMIVNRPNMSIPPYRLMPRSSSSPRHVGEGVRDGVRDRRTDGVRDRHVSPSPSLRLTMMRRAMTQQRMGARPTDSAPISTNRGWGLKELEKSGHGQSINLGRSQSICDSAAPTPHLANRAPKSK